MRRGNLALLNLTIEVGIRARPMPMSYGSMHRAQGGDS